MAVGDAVETTRNIQTFVTEGLTVTIEEDGIPARTIGRVEVEDPIQGVVSVLFQNGIRGNFGPSLSDKLDAIRKIPIQPEVTDMLG